MEILKDHTLQRPKAVLVPIYESTHMNSHQKPILHILFSCYIYFDLMQHKKLLQLTLVKNLLYEQKKNQYSNSLLNILPAHLGALMQLTVGHLQAWLS